MTSALAAVVAATAVSTMFAQAPRAARIVSTSPSVTETLFALGLGDRVVGVSQYCRFPAEVTTLPKVGTFLQPDAERILALRPDLVFVHGVSADLIARLHSAGSRAVGVDDGGMDAVFRTIGQIASAAGVPERGNALIADLRRRLDALRSRQTDSPPTVLLIIGRRPGVLSDLVAVGPHSYLDELIGVAGGRNVLVGPSLPQYPRISMETVLRLDPDVIIDTVDMGETAAERQARGVINSKLWSAYPDLKAVKGGRLYADTTDALVVPGPRVVDASEWLATRIHPR